MSRSEITPSDEGLLVRKRTSVPHPVDRMNGVLGGWSGDADDCIEIRAR